MWILIGFYLFINFFNKKCFPLWHLICSFEKQLGGRKIWSMKKLKKKKKQKNAQKTLLSSAETWIEFLAWKTMKFDFLYFWKSFRELKFFKKIKNKNNPKSIGSLSRKLWPKYETSDEDNTNSTSSSIFFQNFKWEST